MNACFDRVLSSAERKNLPSSAFALPERRALPIPDLAHAKAALSRASMMLAAHTIDRATYNTALRYIYAKYPQLKPDGTSRDSVPVWFTERDD